MVTTSMVYRNDINQYNLELKNAILEREGD